MKIDIFHREHNRDKLFDGLYTSSPNVDEEEGEVGEEAVLT